MHEEGCRLHVQLLDDVLADLEAARHRIGRNGSTRTHDGAQYVAILAAAAGVLRACDAVWPALGLRVPLLIVARSIDILSSNSRRSSSKKRLTSFAKTHPTIMGQFMHSAVIL